MQPDINNVEVPDWIAGGSALLLFIALFLPWVRGRAGALGYSVTWTTGASFGWIAIISVLAVWTLWILILLGVDLPFPTGLAYLGAGGFAALFTVLVMLTRPAGGVATGPGISKMPWIGSYIGILACIGILVGGFMKYQEEQY